MFLGGALTEQITDDDEAGGDADAHLQRGRLARIELGHGFHQGEAGAHRLFCVLLMRLRVTEIGQHAVTEILGNKAAAAGDCLGATAVIGANDVAQFLRIEPCRQGRGTDEVGEHDRELAAFGFGSLVAGAVGPDRMFGRVAKVSARNAPIASRRIRRWPTAVTPRSLRSSAVNLGRLASSIAFSRNACS